MSNIILPMISTVTAFESIEEDNANLAIYKNILEKDIKMESKIFDALIGHEVEITIFQSFPVKGKIIECDNNFLKIEKIERRYNREIIININMIATIKVIK